MHSSGFTAVPSLYGLPARKQSLLSPPFLFLLLLFLLLLFLPFLVPFSSFLFCYSLHFSSFLFCYSLHYHEPGATTTGSPWTYFCLIFRHDINLAALIFHQGHQSNSLMNSSTGERASLWHRRKVAPSRSSFPTSA
jgi:hypothetical protein